MKKNWLIKVVSLIMSLTLIVGTFALTVQADDHDHAEEHINYVSLGDSMTNGYGLEGYDHNSGVADYGDAAYPNQFFDELTKGCTGCSHAQLAMSGIRTEDIHWLLEFDYTNLELIKIIDEFVTENNKKYNKNPKDETEIEQWDQAKWNQYFSCGDYWTLNEICNHSRTEATYAHIMGAVWESYTGCEDHGIVDPSFDDDIPMNGELSEGEKVAVIAKYYQTCVAAADVISLSVGNGNLGVFGFGLILEAIGFKDTNTYKNYNYEDLLRECEPEWKNLVMTLAADLKPVLAEKIPASGLEDAVMYIAVSLALNYAGTLDAILQKNSDVEIILVPVMNTFGDDYATVEGELTIGDLLGLVIEPVNKFIAALPALMQDVRDGAYTDAKFYWAEADESIQCWVNTYDIPLTNRIIRDRFVESIVGEQDSKGNVELGMIWDMLSETENPPVFITLEDIEEYEEACKTLEKLAVYATYNADTAQAVAMYLALEKAVIACKDSAVTLASVFGVGAILGNDPFGPIMTKFEAAIAEKVETVIKENPELASYAALLTLVHTPDTLADAIADSELKGLLALFARCVIGNGIGAHPSEEGHNTLAKAVIGAYSEKYTTSEELDEILSAYPNAPVVKDIYVFLRANGYFTRDQILVVLDEAYPLVKDEELSDEDTALIMDVVYETVFGNWMLTDDDRIAIIGGVYEILDDAYGLSANKNVKAFENIVAYLYDNEYIDNEQAFAIVNYIYWTINDGIQDGDVLDIVRFAYLVLFENMIPTLYVAELPDMTGLDATAKLDILLTIYGELKVANPEIVEDVPELEVVEELYEALTDDTAEGGALLSDEQIFSIVDTAVKALVIEEKPADEAIADVTTAVTEVVKELPLDKQLGVLEKVTETVDKLKESGSEFVPEIPGVGGGEDADTGVSMADISKYLKIAQKVIANLRAEGLWTDDADVKYAALSGQIFTLLMNGNGEIDEKELALSVIDMVFNQEGHTIQDKVRIVVVIYETLEEEGVIADLKDAAIAGLYYVQQLIAEYYDDAYEYGYNYALENGYVANAVDAINQAIDLINGLDLDEIGATDELKALIKAELDATVVTLTKINAALAAGAFSTVDGLINSVFALQDDLYTHLANLQILTVQAGYDAYELVLLPLNEYIKTTVIPQVQECVQTVLDQVYDYAIEKIFVLYGYLVQIDSNVQAAFAQAHEFVVRQIAKALGLVVDANATVAQILAQIRQYIADVYGIVLDVNATITDIINATRDHVDHIFAGEYVVTDDSKILVITNEFATLAETLTNVTWLTEAETATWAEVAAGTVDFDAYDLVVVSYDDSFVVGYAVDQALAQASAYVDYILNFVKEFDAKFEAGLPEMVTANVDVYALAMEYVGAYLEYFEGKEVAECDWAALIGEENLPYVDELRAALKASLIDAGVPEIAGDTIDLYEIIYDLAYEASEGWFELPEDKFRETFGEHSEFTIEIPVADLAVAVAEATLYEYISYNILYSETIAAIPADATVVVLGNYNRYPLPEEFDVNFEITIEEYTFTLAEILEMIDLPEYETPAELDQLIADLAAFDVYEIEIPVGQAYAFASEKYNELFNMALGYVNGLELDVEIDLPALDVSFIENADIAAVITDLYNTASDLILGLELPAQSAQAKAFVTDLMLVHDSYVQAKISGITGEEVYVISIPVGCLIDTVNASGYKLVDLINASLNTELTVGGVTVNLTVNNILDAAANLTSIHPLAYAVMMRNVFFVNISDAFDGGDDYVAKQILNALTITCGHIYDDACDAECNRCGEIREIPGHNYVEISRTEGNCQTLVVITEECEYCGDIREVEGEYGAHVPGAEADCRNNQICTVCQEVLVEKLGHDYGAYRYNNDATCTEDGTKTARCTREGCGARSTIVARGTKLGHNHVAEVTEPTCTEAGYTTYTCSNCGDTYVADETEALEHTYDAAVTEPTCTEAGYTTYTCSVCGDTYVADEVDALGHDYVAAVTEPTCTEAGYTTYTCSVCGDTYVADEVDALGHAYDAAVTEPTCTEDGYTTYTCSVCGDSYVADKTEALGHTPEIVPGKAATCTEEGLTDGKKCTVCGKTLLRQRTIAALGHTEELVPGKAATCTETGLTDGKKCATCGEILVAQETIAVLAHTEVTVPGKAATCTETGLTDGKKCSVCGTVTVAQETIAALGHAEVTVPGKAATCTETGLTDGKKCSVCGTVTVAQETIAALGHTEETIPAVEPTTSSTGSTEGKKCSVCGEILVAPETIAKKSLAWLWVLLSAAVAGGGGTGFFFLRKRFFK